MKPHAPSHTPWSVLSPYLYAQRRHVVAALFLVIIVVGIELSQPYLIKEAIDRYIVVPGPDAVAIFWMAGAYFGLVLTAFILAYYQDILLQKTGQAIVRSIRLDLFKHIQGLSLKYFDQRSSGSIITNIVNDTEALNNFFSQFLSNTLRGALSLILILVFMFRLDTTIALFFLFSVPVIVVISVFFQKAMRKINGEIRTLLSRAISFLAENLNGMAIIQIFHQQVKQAAEFDRRNKTLMKANIQENRINVLFVMVTEFASDLGVTILIWFGGRGVIHGALSFGILYAFIGYIRRFFQPIGMITQQMNALQSMIGASERIARTLNEKPGIVEAAGVTPPQIQGAVTFAHVFLAYRDQHMVLKDVCLDIRAGERIGFVGASGAGKSSLMNLLARFYDTTRGAVIIDGKDVREWPVSAIRRVVGIVQQDVMLFAGTILDNIRSFRPEITVDQVRAASRLVGAEPFILRLSKGYDTLISERGRTLSAGERQLLSFARAMVFNPRILILDEATASLDSASESVLQEAIHQVSHGRTLLVIAHRLSTVEQMDSIVVLDQGKIVEQGTHEELLTLNAYYARLHRSGILLE